MKKALANAGYVLVGAGLMTLLVVNCAPVAVSGQGTPTQEWRNVGGGLGAYGVSNFVTCYTWWNNRNSASSPLSCVVHP